MDTALWVIAAACAAAVVCWLLLRGGRQPAADAVCLPGNAMEEMLFRNEADLASSRFRQVLLESRLLAMGEPDDPAVPAITRAIAPASLCEDVDGTPTVSGSAVALPPVVLCFTSGNVLNTAGPDIRAVVRDTSALREYPAAEIVDRAVRHNADVVVNPGCAGSRRFSAREMRHLLDAAPASP